MLLDNRFITYDKALTSLYQKLNTSKHCVGMFEGSEQEVHYKSLHGTSFCVIFPLEDHSVSKIWPIQAPDFSVWQPQFDEVLASISKGAVKGKHIVLRPRYGQEDSITICVHCTGKADALDLNLSLFITSVGIFTLFEIMLAYTKLLEMLTDKYDLTVGRMYCTVVELTLVEKDWYITD